jgi:hypothetical protein
VAIGQQRLDLPLEIQELSASAVLCSEQRGVIAIHAALLKH